MNTAVTSKEQILSASRELIRTQGWTSFNIRGVATTCHVSAGSIYNYFDSKSHLIEEIVESVWREVFCPPNDPAAFSDIVTCITWLFERMEYG